MQEARRPRQIARYGLALDRRSANSWHMTHLAALPRRAVLAIEGEDRIPFLQGLVSNDVAAAEPGHAVWAALLTPQGKWLADFFIFADGDRLLLDCERDQAPDVLQRLSRYRLRSKATLRIADDLSVYAAWDGAPTVQAIAAPDPRLPEAGWRLLSAIPLPTTALEADWDRHRLALGLPDGSRDLEAEKTVLLEAGFDELHGVSWSKGCYMGQELTARTKYRGLVKRRLLPVAIEGPLPPPGSPVLRDGAEVGTHAIGMRTDGSRGAAARRARRRTDLRCCHSDAANACLDAVALRPRGDRRTALAHCQCHARSRAWRARTGAARPRRCAGPDRPRSACGDPPRRRDPPGARGARGKMARAAALGGMGHGRGDAAAPVAAATPPRSLRRARQSGDEPAAPSRSRPGGRRPAELQDEVPRRGGGVLPDPGPEALCGEPGGGGILPLSHTQHGRCATVAAAAQPRTAAGHRRDGTFRCQEGLRRCSSRRWAGCDRRAPRFVPSLPGKGRSARHSSASPTVHGLAGCAGFPGWVDDKPAFFAGIDVFCLPSHHEPFGIVLIEAMAQAMPIVATDSEGPSEILRDGIDG